MSGGIRCSVYSCKSRHAKNCGLSFFSFPKNLQFQKVWISKCNRNDEFNPANARVCSLHFLPTDYERNLKAELLNYPARKKLKPDAVPSLLLNSGDTVTPPDEDTNVRNVVEDNAVLYDLRTQTYNFIDPKRIKSEEIETFEEDLNESLMAIPETSESFRPNDTLYTNTDDLTAFGIYVAEKLRKMDETQQISAEALIQKVLIKGLKKQLTDDTDVVDVNKCILGP